MNLWIVVLAVVLIVALSGVALYMWRKVWLQDAENAQKIAEENQKHLTAQAYIVESLTVICHTLLRGEMNISEGAIRLKVLLDNLDEPERGDIAFEAINTLHDAVSRFDTHEVRKALPKIERRLQDAKREAVEVAHEAEFMVDVESLLAHLKPSVH